MNLKLELGKLDKVALGKAIGVLAIGWLALPILYFMFRKKEVKNDKEKQGRSDDQSESAGSVQ